MNGKIFVDGLKKTNPNLHKKISESLRHGIRSYKKHGGVENYDYVVCKICDCIKYGNFSNHLKLHDLVVESYLKLFPNAIIVPQKKRDNLIGDKNPGYKHGGKLSPWSEKSTVHTTEQIAQSKRKAKQNYTSIRSLQYWINKGFDVKEATVKLGDFQKRDKAFFVFKYGDHEGEERWKQKVESWLKTMNNKTDTEKKEINLKRAYKNGSVSKGEISLLNDIKLKIENSEEIISQLILPIPGSNNFLKYDIAYKNKIIEYNGDIWHANPKNYKKTDIPNFPKNFLTAEQLWNKDNRKIQIAINNGFSVLVVWESDYKNNKDKILQECLNFLTA